jgi:hypothetical protein
MSTGDGGRRNRPRLTPLAPADYEFLYVACIYARARVAGSYRTSVSASVMLAAEKFLNLGVTRCHWHYFSQKVFQSRCHPLSFGRFGGWRTASIQMMADVYGHLFPRGDDGAEMVAAERAFFQ